jgi:hypothetical protein
MNATPTAKTAPTTDTARTISHLLAIRQRFQHAITQLAPISTGISWIFIGFQTFKLRAPTQNQLTIGRVVTLATGLGATWKIRGRT